MLERVCTYRFQTLSILKYFKTVLVEVTMKLNPALLSVVGLRNVKTSSNFPRAFLVHVPKCRKLRVDWCFTSSLGGCKIFLGKVPNTSHLPIVTLPLSERLIYLIIAVKISTGYQFTSREKLRAN